MCRSSSGRRDYAPCRSLCCPLRAWKACPEKIPAQKGFLFQLCQSEKFNELKRFFFQLRLFFCLLCYFKAFFNEKMFKFHKGHCSTIRWRFCHFKTKFKQNKNLQITIGPINCFRRHNLIWKKKRKSENDKWEEAMKRDETRLDGWPNEKLLSGCVNHIYSGIALLWIHYTHAFNAAGLQSEWLKIHTCTPPHKELPAKLQIIHCGIPWCFWHFTETMPTIDWWATTKAFCARTMWPIFGSSPGFNETNLSKKFQLLNLVLLVHKHIVNKIGWFLFSENFCGSDGLLRGVGWKLATRKTW